MLTVSTGQLEGRIDFDIGKFLYYAFLFWSLFLLIDPFYFGYGAFRVTRDLGPLKYFGLVFGVAALFFILVGWHETRLLREAIDDFGNQRTW